MNRANPPALATSAALRKAFRSWDGLIEAMPIAVYACDAEGHILQFNRRAAEMWGRSPKLGDGCELYCGSHRIWIDGEYVPHDRLPMADVLRTGKPIRGREVSIERPDGSRVWAMVHIEPVFDRRGKLLGAVNCFHETTELRRATEALREQDRRLAVTYEHASRGITEVDREGRRMRVNEAACRILEATREELAAGSIFDNVHWADLGADEENFRRLVAGEIDRYTVEKRFLSKDGRSKWIDVTCSAVRDEAGQFLYAVREFEDISERKRIAAALRESDQRLAVTYEHATVGISEADADGKLLRVNEASCALTQYSREELLSRPSFFRVMRPEEADQERETYRKQVAGEIDRYSIEKRIRRKDGSEIWASVLSSAVRDADGRFLYAVRVIQDITERKRAEENLRDSERRFRDLLEALPAAVYTTDAEGRITYFNQGAVDLWGSRPVLNEDKWCGSVRLFTSDGAPLPHEQCPMAIAIKEQRPIRNAEAVAERPDGTRVPFVPYPTPLFDESGKMIGAVNMLVDITDRKAAEARQQALLDELNHRVKNTLATVQSLASQTARGASSLKAFRDRLDGRLIALSRAHDQLSRRNWQHADLRELATSGLEPFRNEQGRNVRIEGDAVVLDPRSALTLAMIFHELATNAAKYGALSQPFGRLDIRWTTESNGSGPKLHLSWSESGGPVVAPPKRRGFGMKLVERGVEMELQGAARVDFATDGVRCEIEVPLAAVGR